MLFMATVALLTVSQRGAGSNGISFCFCKGGPAHELPYFISVYQASGAPSAELMGLLPDHNVLNNSLK